jgi:hypothetical protein
LQNVQDMNRKLLINYHPNLKQVVERKYLVNEICQIKEFNIQNSVWNNSVRKRYNPYWFDEFGSYLEYSDDVYKYLKMKNTFFK